MSDGFSFAIENEKEFSNYLRKIGKNISDFRVPFRLISSDFYRSQKIIFNLKSPGLYPPLGGFNPNRIVNGLQTARERAETLKERKVGFAYPLLVGETQNLRDSTLSPNHPNSVYFLGRQELVIGTNVPYGKYHQSDAPRTKLPKRKFVFIDGGPRDASKSSRLQGRSQRWFNIINDYVIQVLAG